MDDEKSMVIISGSDKIHAGFSGEDTPRIDMPGLYESQNGPIRPLSQKQYNVGEQCNIYNKIFQDLKIESKDYQILLSWNLWMKRKDVEYTLNELFENLEVGKLFFSYKPVLSCYASGRTTALMIYSSHTMTQIWPVFDGYLNTNNIKSSRVGGRAIAMYLKNLLTRRGIHIDEDLDSLPVSNEMKKTVISCLPSRPKKLYYEKEKAVKYQLPDGRIIEIGPERFLAAELLFDPSLDDNSQLDEDMSIGSLFSSTIKDAHISMRKEFLNNTVFVGGNCHINDIYPRLEKEFQLRCDKKKFWIQTKQHDPTSIFSLLPTTLIQKVESQANTQNKNFELVSLFNEEKLYTAWIGGSVLSSLSTFQKLWITKEDYLEKGENLILKKEKLYSPKFV